MPFLASPRQSGVVLQPSTTHQRGQAPLLLDSVLTSGLCGRSAGLFSRCGADRMLLISIDLVHTTVGIDQRECRISVSPPSLRGYLLTYERLTVGKRQKTDSLRLLQVSRNVCNSGAFRPWSLINGASAVVPLPVGSKRRRGVKTQRPN